MWRSRAGVRDYLATLYRKYTRTLTHFRECVQDTAATRQDTATTACSSTCDPLFSVFAVGTTLERLWLIYELINAEASGAEKIEVDQADPSNNSPLGFCSITVCVYVRVCACTHACVPMHM
jgi:hypothetical protein